METGLPIDPLVEYNKIIAEIQACNSFKYSAYRTAYKLLILHRSLGFQNVSLDLIKGVFSKYQIHSTDNYLLLDQEETENILYDIFFASSKQDGIHLNVEKSVELTKLFLNSMLKFYSDPLPTLRNQLILKIIFIFLLMCVAAIYWRLTEDWQLKMYWAEINEVSVKFDKFVDLVISFLYPLSDRNSKHGNSALFLKIVLICISSSSLQNKYQYWFSQLVDHNLCLPRRRLQSLLQIFMLITDYLSESNTFSETLIQPTLDSCFTKNQGVLGINEDDFICWLKKEPQILVWLSTFHRLCISLKVNHNIQCSACGVFPIVGLRYHCLQCIQYDLCQLCFFTARSNKHHKPQHNIREYCTQSSFYETTSAFIKEVFKRLCGHSSKLQYLPVNIASGSNKNDAVFEKFTLGTPAIENSAGSKHLHQNIEDKIRNELQRITCEIEKEARLMLSDVATELSTNDLIDHQARFLQERLDKMRALQFELFRKKEVAVTKNELGSTGHSLTPEIEKDSTLCIPDSSGFSTWLESTKNDETYSKQLHSELEHIMAKLNCMLESNFSLNDDNSLS